MGCSPAVFEGGTTPLGGIKGDFSDAIIVTLRRGGDV